MVPTSHFPLTTSVVLLLGLLALAGCPSSGNGSGEASGGSGAGETGEPELPEVRELKGPGWIGITFAGLTPDEIGRLQGQRGIRLKAVTPGGPSAVAGLQTGDILLTANGEPTDDPQVFARFLRTSKPGQVLEFVYVRGDETLKVKVTVGVKDVAALLQKALETGSAYLASLQLEKGAWPDFTAQSEEESTALTAFAVRTLVRMPDAVRNGHAATIDRGLAYVLGCEKGGAVQPVHLAIRCLELLRGGHRGRSPRRHDDDGQRPGRPG